MDYGQEFDFQRSFFDQWHELTNKVPRLGIDIVNCQNSYYCNYCGDDKNCYLDIAGEANEDSYFNLFTKYSKNCADCTFAYHSELCYECISCYKCYHCCYSRYLENCSDCNFCFDLKGCKNCLFSTNLKNKEYYILNQPYSKEEYQKKIAQMNFGSYAALDKYKKLLHDQEQKAIHRDMYISNSENCTGDNIQNSKNCLFSFNITNCEDGKYLYDVLDAKDCYDLNYSLYKPELAYELMSTLSMKFSAFNMASHYCHDVFYSDQCNNSGNLFGCIALNQKQYCILNKQYSKEEYEKLVPKIIEHMIQTGEWGEFFPTAIAPFAYNETVAQEYFPLTKVETERRGWKWKAEEAPDFSGVTKKIPAAKLPATIAEIPDDILNWAIECAASKKPFRIQKAELEFYRKMNLPIPHFHPDIRHQKRMALRNPRKLWQRNCANCHKFIPTTYAPERPETVYCEECYLKSVY